MLIELGVRIIIYSSCPNCSSFVTQLKFHPYLNPLNVGGVYTRGPIAVPAAVLAPNDAPPSTVIVLITLLHMVSSKFMQDL